MGSETRAASQGAAPRAATPPSDPAWTPAERAAMAQALDAAARVSISERALWEVRVPVARAGRLEAELRASGAASGALAVEETTWGASDAVVLLSTPAGAPSPAELIAQLTAGGATPTPAGTRLVESPLRPPT